MSTTLQDEPILTNNSSLEVEEPVKKVLDDDKQNVLFEILRCAVCLEIPKGKVVQIRTCEKGHHFCSTCHKKLRSCAICRGRLFLGRNFVVEEIILKLGYDLGISRNYLPPPIPTPNYCPGKFPCLLCRVEFYAGRMLPHSRKVHSAHLTENKRSNPYNGRFDWMFDLNPSSSKTANFHLLHVSDMGLFTLIVRNTPTGLRAWLQMLADDTLASAFRYRITCQIVHANGSCKEFGIHKEVMLSNRLKYDSIPAEKMLTIEKSDFPFKPDDNVKLIISIWRDKKEDEKDFPLSTLMSMPDETWVFQNDRKTRRTRNRNRRKKLSREKKRILNAMERGFAELSTNEYPLKNGISESSTNELSVKNDS